MTTSRCIIPTGFTIPAGLEHKWVLVAGPFRSVIKPCRADSVSLRRIRLSPEEIPDDWQGFEDYQLDDPQQFMAMLNEKELDWIGEVMAQLRGMCNGT